MAVRGLRGWISGNPLPPAPPRPSQTIVILEDATLIVPLGTRFKGSDLQMLPVRLSPREATFLVPARDLEVRHTGLWHGMLASEHSCSPPPIDGFHHGPSPAFPKRLLIHPAMRYLRRGSLYFPYLHWQAEFHLLCVPHQGRFHTTLLIASDGFILPCVYTSVDCPISAPFPAAPCELSSLIT